MLKIYLHIEHEINMHVQNLMIQDLVITNRRCLKTAIWMLAEMEWGTETQTRNEILYITRSVHTTRAYAWVASSDKLCVLGFIWKQKKIDHIHTWYFFTPNEITVGILLQGGFKPHTCL